MLATITPSVFGSRASATADAGLETSPKTDQDDLKDRDLRIALRIAGYAGLPTRDRHGNVVPDVWTQHGATEEVSTQLLDVSAVRGMLQEQLKAHMEARKEMLLDLDDPSVVAKWVIDFSTKWEEEYREKVKRKWDIAQTILTAMADTINEVAEVFDATSEGVTMRFMREQIRNLYATDAAPRLLYKAQDDALVRALFRSDHVGPMLARIAGKILQKSLVCNKAGMYSARVQRNDVTRERDDAIEAFVQAHFDNSPIFKSLQQEWNDPGTLKLYCTDHTREEPGAAGAAP